MKSNLQEDWIVFVRLETFQALVTRYLFFLTQSDYERLGRVKDKTLDEYIRRYNLAIQFSDSVLRLISLYGIAELISHEGGKHEFSSFMRDEIGFSHEAYRINRAVRNLVSHRVAKERDTPKILGEALNRSLTEFKFSREDRNQMELVEKSANDLAVKLKQYLEAQLLLKLKN